VSPARAFSALRERPRALDALLAALVLAVALVPRARDLDVIVTPDETRWACRSINFHAALAAGDPAGTYQKEHPGVITMWLGGLGAPAPGDELAAACRDVPPGKLTTVLPRVTLDELRDHLFSARLRVALFVALGVAGVYLLAARLLGRPTALLAAVLVALDPLYLALGRVLHLDAVTGTLMTLSLLALLAHLEAPVGRRLLLVSGALAGLAALNKSPALFLGPMAALVILAHALRRGAGFRAAAVALALWAASAAAAFAALWPALWVDPGGVLTAVLRGAIGYAEEPHEGSNYFWGAVRPDPGPAFYAVSWLLRASPAVLAGVVLALARRRRIAAPAERAALAALVAYAVLFGAFMSLGAKKFDRYFVPAYPALAVVAAIGWASALPALARALRRARPAPARVGRAAAALAVVGAAAAAAATVGVLAHHPYYFSYYNPLLGGAPAARWALLIGWGEGLDQVAATLNARPDAQRLLVAAPYRSAFGLLFRGRALELDEVDPASVDYYLLYVNQVQRRLDAQVVEPRYGLATPEAVARFRGIEYAWLYPNDNYVAAAELIDRLAEPGDAVLVRADARLARQYRGPLPLVTFEPDAPASELLDTVTGALARWRRLWYVRYDQVHQRPGLTALEYELATGLTTLARRPLPELEVRLLAVDGAPALGRSQPLQPLYAAFGSGLRLEGLALSHQPAAWGRDLGLLLGWRLAAPTDRDLTAFAHLVGPDGHRWSQVDRPVMDGGLRRTSAWPGDVAVTDRLHLGVPAGAPPGRYQLLVGVYDAGSGERLDVTAGGERQADGVLRLEVEVGRPLHAPGVEELGLEAVVERPAGAGLTWLGYVSGGAAVGGGVAPLGLAWRADARPLPEVRARLEARDASGTLVGASTVEPVAASFPTAAWRRGDVVRGWHEVALDGRARAGAGLLSLTLVDERGEALGPTLTAPLRIDGPLRAFLAPGAKGAAGQALLGGQARLLAARLPRASVPAGASVPVTLTWLAERSMELPLTVFLHALDEGGAVVAQVDREPLAGARPTTSWLPREVLLDPLALALPADLAPGRYRLVAGLYDPRTLERLPAHDRSGRRLAGDAVPLGWLEVMP